MYKKILVPLDGSPLAEGILPQVGEMARVHGARIHLLRVGFALVFPGADPAEAQLETIVEAEGYIEGIRKRLEAEGIPAEASVRYGFPAEEILTHARRNGVDLIAMATHGRTGPARWVLGSVAEQVLRKAEVPVLLFRPPRAAQGKETLARYATA
ncbi:MAG: hypothetical protein A3J27_15600 [Candidatus Tectomicrobia bacterium RIFCSPLOWO2_12_FULL_69_37]|nr:MAG: hypothetical protein A3J27_15600 [Candidatus Tectomicrobia bacterium RIFCSPLOWO2_12_FULL_69_37]OGL58748.1 MAG: hypothetical protein A3I72_13580 [Candidatus Tectomicrobia bacterium RIFCSPLOWO2_02_FULL_70_19]